MTRKPPAAVLAALCSLAALAPAPAPAEADDAAELAAAFGDDRPNLIFFLTDDQRNDFLGCTGHPLVETPRIDALAAEGVLFENAFVTTSICAASRATLLTGLYERTHRFTFGTPPIASIQTDDSYPAVLKREGYRTGFIGKFGVKVRPGAREEMFDFFQPLGRNPYHHKMPDGSRRHETDRAADFALEFIRGAAAGEAPFCLSVSFNASHAEDGDKEDHFPFPEGVGHLYEGVEMPPPRLADPAVFEAQPEFLRKSMNRDRYFWRWDTAEKYQHNMRNYLRMISGIDAAIGRVLDELEKRGIADNTVVIYMADNGYYAASRGFAGKWSHYEESLRVPLIIRDPRAPEGQRGKTVAAPALNVDIAPTLLDFADARACDRHQGASLAPFVTGAAPADWRSDFFCEHRMDHRSIPKWEGVRGGRYKYARYYEQDPPFEFLHDLSDDPMELANLAGDPAHREALEAMRARAAELSANYDSQAAADAGRVLERMKFGMLDPAAHAASGSALDEAEALAPGTPAVLLARADAHEKAGEHGKALRYLDQLVAGHPEVGDLLLRRGSTRLFHGDFAGAIADFDALIEADPERAPYLWQRGIAQYYAGDFDGGAKQFEIHKKVNPRDVENAAWHFLCVARRDGLDSARENLIPVEGDARVPMAEVQRLFAGELKPEDVLAAAERGNPAPDDLRNHLCYAHLYLGLYFEAQGDAGRSLGHIEKAAVEYAMPHYMGEVARVHLRARKK